MAGHKTDSIVTDVPGPTAPRRLGRKPGQALIEYVLIVVLVSLAVAVVLMLSGPVIGNVFSNVVYNLLQQTTTPYATLDSAQFWHYVTVVAAWTPPGLGITPNQYVPPTATLVQPSQTMTGTLPTSTPTASATTTATGTLAPPSATMTDAAYNAPFDDTAADSNGVWHEPFTDAFAALNWTADLYKNQTQIGTTYICANLTTLSTSTPCLSDVNYSGSLPNGADEIRYKGYATFEGRSYEAALTVGPGDTGVFKINGTVIVSVDNQTGVTPRTGSYSNYQAPFTGTANPIPLEVDYTVSNSASASNQVKLVFSTLADYAPQTCTWAELGPGHQSSTSWQDAPPGTKYQISSNCNLRLRGWIDLSTLTAPALSFYDQWSLGPNGVALLGVREYNFNAGQNQPWVWVQIHNPGDRGLNWTREILDLTHFGPDGIDFMHNSNQKIEIAFKVVNNDANPSNTDYGWAVDDIRVEDSNPVLYQLPIADDFDGNTSQPPPQWTGDCDWGATTEAAFSGTTSYASNPGADYTPSSDCSLYLGPRQGGLADLSAPPTGTVPQLTFETMYGITGTTTTLSVEVVSQTDHSTFPIPWQPLTPNGSSKSYLAQGTMTTHNAWQPVVFDLSQNGPNHLAPGKYYFRFRLLADNTQTTDKGWYLDDVQWRFQTPPHKMSLPWADTIDDATNWTLSDNWALTNTAHSPSHALFSGSYDTSGNLNNYAQLKVPIDIGSSPNCSTTDPVLTFWSRWAVGAGATLDVDYSQDNGSTWSTATNALWEFMAGQTSDPFQTDGVGNYDTNLAWRRFMVDLKPFACNTQKPTIMIRFHMLVPSGSPSAEGWYVDDVALFDINQLDQPTFTDSIACQANGLCDPKSIQVTAAQAFKDNASDSPQPGWYMGGTWQSMSTPGDAHFTYAWGVTTPGTAYPSPEDGIMELAPALDLTGFTQGGPRPVLSFWTKYAVDPTAPHKVKAEIMDVTGSNPNLTPSAAGWTLGQTQWIAAMPGGSGLSYATDVNLGWTRQLMDLSQYAGHVIRLRFRLDALTAAQASSNIGLWLNAIYVGSLSQMPGYSAQSLPFQEKFASANNWITEGDWQSVTDWGPFSYLPPSDSFTAGSANTQWDASYYHYFTTDTTGPWSLGAAWTEPSGSQICSSATSHQISTYTAVGTPQQQTRHNIPAFAYHDGTPNSSPGGTRSAVYVTGAGNSLQFTVAADQHQRWLQIYVGAGGATATLTLSLSTGPHVTFPTFSDNSANSTTSQEYDVTYSAASANQTLTVTLSNTASLQAQDAVYLEAAEVTPLTTTGGDALTPQPGTPALISGGSTIDLTNNEGDNGIGMTDWAHWGLNPPPSDFDHRVLKQCIPTVLHASDQQLDYTWDANNPPLGAPPGWATNANAYQYFAAVFKRSLTIKPGDYRFWANADDGVRLIIDGSLIKPDATLPYPWTSAGADGWITQPGGPQSYFYSFTCDNACGGSSHLIEVDYYQKTETSAQLKFQFEEVTTLLHSSALGQPPQYILYTPNQNTSAFINGYIPVPANHPTTVTFYERFVDGSNGGSGDPMYVALSVDGGFTWNDLTADVIDADPDSPNKGNPVSFTSNLNDTSDPFTTYQNWHKHTINLSMALCGTTTCLTPSGSTQIILKFQLDARASVTQGAGWFITNLAVN